MKKEATYDRNTTSHYNTWNPDMDYGTEYATIHINICAKGYEFPDFCFTDVDKEIFDEAIRNIFTSLGWSEMHTTNDDDYTIWTKDIQYLYVEPHLISGEILKSEVKNIVERIEAKENKEIITIECVKLFNTLTAAPFSEYVRVIRTFSGAIEGMLVKNAITTRKNLFVSENVLVAKVISFIDKIYPRVKPVSKDVEYQIMYAMQDNFLNNYVRDILTNLKEDGIIVSTCKCEFPAVRTLNKTERKKNKKANQRYLTSIA